MPQQKKVRRRKFSKKPTLDKVAEDLRVFGTSWRVQTRVFFEQSTLHGVRYIAEGGRPFLEKLGWFACVAVGAVATVVIILSLWEKFQTNPTITGLDTDFHNWKVPFPAVTVCQEMPGNNGFIQEFVQNGTLRDNVKEQYVEEALLHFTQLSFDSLPKFYEKVAVAKFINKSMVPDDSDIKELVFKLVNKCEDIFEMCEFKSLEYNCCDGFFPVFTERGFCYTFNSRLYESKIPGSDFNLPEFKMQFITETDLKWSFKFRVRDTKVNMRIYILNSNEQAGIDVQPQHVWDYKVNKISFSVKETYTTQDTRQLSIKQRHCIFADEVPLKIDKLYTYTGCSQQCRMDNAMKLCNCVPFFYSTGVGNHYRHCKVSELHCLNEHLESILNMDKCSCQLGCANTVYEVEKLNDLAGSKTPEMEIQFVSWPMVRYKREVLFGWVDLLVSFGGIAGLFLGFSLLSGVEIIYYFTVRAFCMALRERDELERIRKEEKSKPPPDYDLSLVPYFISDPFPGQGLNQVAKGHYRDNAFRNRIAPLEMGGKNNKWDYTASILPPFGIDFVN